MKSTPSSAAIRTALSRICQLFPATAYSCNLPLHFTADNRQKAPRASALTSPSESDRRGSTLSNTTSSPISPSSHAATDLTFESVLLVNAATCIARPLHPSSATILAAKMRSPLSPPITVIHSGAQGGYPCFSRIPFEMPDHISTLISSGERGASFCETVSTPFRAGAIASPLG